MEKIYREVDASKRTPTENIEVITDNGKMYLIRGKWCVWDVKAVCHNSNVNQPRVWFEEIVKNVPFQPSYLSLIEVAKLYGQKVYYKWATPEGDDWLNKSGNVNAHILREMEQGSIKDVYKKL